MDDNRLISIFTKEELERIQQDDVFWWRVNEMGLLNKFNSLFAYLQCIGGAEI